MKTKPLTFPRSKFKIVESTKTGVRQEGCCGATAYLMWMEAYISCGLQCVLEWISVGRPFESLGNHRNFCLWSLLRVDTCSAPRGFYNSAMIDFVFIYCMHVKWGRPGWRVW